MCIRDREKVSVGYDGKPLIEEVEIALRKGEILTLLGPNGAGKSTILKSIARQLSLIAGTVRLDGEDMRTLTGAELSKKMAVVMTKRLRGELMTCEDVVATGRYPYTGRFGMLRAEDHAAVQNAMELVPVSYTHLDVYKRQALHRQALRHRPHRQRPQAQRAVRMQIRQQPMK